MISTPQEILEAGLKCAEHERLAIANGLLESLPDDVEEVDDEELLAELRRRSADWSGAVPWDVLKAELLAETE